MSTPIRRLTTVFARKRPVLTTIVQGIDPQQPHWYQQPHEPLRFFSTSSSPTSGVVASANVVVGNDRNDEDTPTYNNKNNVVQPSSVSGQQIQQGGEKQPQRLRQQRFVADPMAKRPNKLCDPYGQGGRPMSLEEAQSLQKTIHDDWRIVEMKESESASSAKLYLVRDFSHVDFLYGARFLAKVAAVAQINNHFPSLVLDRQIRHKNWHVYTRVTCHTKVLRGLSQHDFHLAMVRTYTSIEEARRCMIHFHFCFSDASWESKTFDLAVIVPHLLLVATSFTLLSFCSWTMYISWDSLSPIRFPTTFKLSDFS
jgi:pterin-4a-carbinolamine dehydratase